MRRDPRIGAVLEDRPFLLILHQGPQFLGVEDHGAKLVETKRAAEKSQPLLAKRIGCPLVVTTRIASTASSTGEASSKNHDRPRHVDHSLGDQVAARSVAGRRDVPLAVRMRAARGRL